MEKAILTEYTVASERVRSPLKIALVSDLHERRALDILNLLRKAQPDLIAVAGDTFERTEKNIYVPNMGRERPNFFLRFLFGIICPVNFYLNKVFNKRNQPNSQNAYSFLSHACDIAPVFMSIGNHEQFWLREDDDFFKKCGVHLLDNEDMEIVVKNNFIIIGGLSSQPDESWLYHFSNKQGLRLLLSHHPEFYDEMIRGTDIDLILSGHNHGGQIRIFGKGMIAGGIRLFPKYDKGLFDGRLVISAGCANTAVIPRWGNPRELVLIHLVKK